MGNEIEHAAGVQGVSLNLRFLFNPKFGEAVFELYKI